MWAHLGLISPRGAGRLHACLACRFTPSRGAQGRRGRDGAGQRAARSLRVSTSGTARGAFVQSSKNGVGPPSPRTHQPSMLEARRAKTPSDGGPGAFGGSGPAAERWTQHRVSGTTVGLVVHEGMNHADDREAQPGGGIGNRGPAAIGVPAQDLVGEAQAPHGLRACGELHASGRHLEDVRSASRVEHVRSLEETREHLAVPAIANEAEAAGRGDVARDAAHAAAPATKREVQGHALHRTERLRGRGVGYRFYGHVKP
jgi:hypothetical protein